MYYGYARVSTVRQSLKRQQESIKKYAAERGEQIEIFSEKYTGTKLVRPAWQKLLRKVQDGDTIVFDEISRMSRQEEGFEVYKKLYTEGINLVFLKQHSLDTENFKAVQQIARTGEIIADTFIDATNKVLMILAERQVKAAFQGAEHEAKFIDQRTKQGMKVNHAGEKIAAARTGKTYETKKARLKKELIRKNHLVFGGTWDDRECIRQAGIARNTFYKYKQQLLEEMKIVESTI